MSFINYIYSFEEYFEKQEDMYAQLVQLTKEYDLFECSIEGAKRGCVLKFRAFVYVT